MLTIQVFTNQNCSILLNTHTHTHIPAASFTHRHTHTTFKRHCGLGMYCTGNEDILFSCIYFSYITLWLFLFFSHLG
uniref:Uncharacterized protein n=1 Tax=Anguilla anguilla TaxID=7936 RepID=A0A0E9X1R6_ANGAN